MVLPFESNLLGRYFATFLLCAIFEENVVKCAGHSTGPCEHAHTGHEHVLFESVVRHDRLLQFS